MALDPLLEVRDLRARNRLAQPPGTIVSGVDLTVARGETVGIVGESGSGKTVTARAVAGLLPPGLEASGDVHLAGRQLLGLPERALRRLRGTALAYLPQDPFTMLNPLITAGAHLVETLARRGADAGQGEVARRLAEVGLTQPGVAARYPFQLSGGMRQRVGLAAALAGDPDLLIADEPATALDVTTQRQVLLLLKRLQEQRGMSLLLITHDLRVAFSICERVYIFYAGRVLETGSAAALAAEPLHPYTHGLLLSEPDVERRRVRLRAIEGSVPAADAVADRCAFASRCWWTAPTCVSERPPLAAVDRQRWSACVRVEELRARLMPSEDAEVAGERPASPAARPRLLELEGVFKAFRGGRGQREPVHALHSVSLSVCAGESVGLVGETGSGKTTLGRCVVGLERPDAGTITVDGIPSHALSALTRSQIERLRRTVQMVFQDPYSSLNPARTVGESLREALRRTDAPSRRHGPSVGALLERVGLPAAYERRKPAALSGGERQRVAIARAIAVRPQLVVCDEPVSALDVSVQAQILNLLADLREQLDLSLLFISHDLSVIRQVADRVYVLFRGEIVEDGPTDVVLDSPRHPYTRQLVEAVPRADGSWLQARPA